MAFLTVVFKTPPDDNPCQPSREPALCSRSYQIGMGRAVAPMAWLRIFQKNQAVILIRGVPGALAMMMPKFHRQPVWPVLISFFGIRKRIEAMTKTRIALLGAAIFSVAMLGAGAASAQYYDRDGDRYEDGDRVYDNGTETVIVRPDRDYIEKHTMIGRVNGEVNPTAYTLSRSVDLADLDLSQPADRREMRNRVYEVAVNLCYELDARVPGLREDESGDRECVRTATDDAIRNVMERRY